MVKRGAVRRYKEPEQYAYINVNDKDLIPFRVSLPMPKQIEKVQGYGLMPNDQVVTKEIYPRKLEYLEKEIRAETYKRTDLQSINRKEQVVHEEIWKRLYSDFDKYREEIEWIREQWYYRFYGKWYFVNGQPVWITGDHWFYLNYWHLEQYGKPDYRDRDRRWFLAQYYLMSTTEAPKRNRQGHLMYNVDGTLVMEDKGSRTVMGSNNVKSRQVGETSKACSIITNRTMRTKEGKSGIQAESGDGSASIFKNKVVLSHRKLPFFFKPTTYNHDPQERLEWKSQNPEYGIDAMLDYASTIYRHFYDKENLNYILVDEAGKLDPRESVKDRHDVLLKCMEVRDETFMFYTTTVEEMDKSAGKEFLELSKNSHFQDRDETGKTVSGLVNVFFPAYDGKFFVGKFGESIIDTPTPDQVPYMSKAIKNSKGDIMGAKEYLNSRRKELEKKGDIKGLISYKRLEPMSFREAFTPPAKGEFFDRHVVETRIGELQMDDKSNVIRGNFEWKDSSDWSKGVTFVPNKEGRWNVSEILQSGDTNKFVKQRNIYRPNNGNKYILSADAYRAEKTEGGRMSDGGGAVLKVKNNLVDTPDKDVKDWDTERFVCTYLARPGSTDKFSEDMLKTCVYYGAYCYPENNVNHVQIDFERWKYHGYLLYGTNKTTGKKNSVPGFYTSTNKQELFNHVRDWVSKHGLYCEHEEILREVSEIRGLDDMTNYDLFTAVAGALYGQDILVKRNEVRGQTLGMDVSGIFKKRTYG